MNHTPVPDDAGERLLRLETAVAHLQHDFEQLHGVALELQAELRQWTLRLGRIEHQLDRLAEPPETRSPADERPPHW
jgi:SlyX protein